MSENHEGIDALIYMLVVKWSQLQDYDILVINSALRDYTRVDGANHMRKEYLQKVRHLVELLDILTLQNDSASRQRFANSEMKKQMKIVWRGNSLYAHQYAPNLSVEELEMYDREVESILRTSKYITFVNLTAGLELLPPMPRDLPKGGHIGQFSYKRRHSNSLLWTSVCTQILLNHMCSEGTVEAVNNAVNYRWLAVDSVQYIIDKLTANELIKSSDVLEPRDRRDSAPIVTGDAFRALSQPNICDDTNGCNFNISKLSNGE